MKARDPYQEFLDEQKPARIVSPPREIKDDWEYIPSAMAYRNMTTGEWREEKPDAR